MMSPSDRTASLQGIRREIDEIDDAIVDLLIRRMAASGRVKAEKSLAGVMPVWPAREAQILRRLIARSAGRISPELLVRLWREILTSSTLVQAPLTLHVSRPTAENAERGMLIRDHFCSMPVKWHDSDEAIVSAVSVARGDLGAVATDSGWFRPFCDGKSEGVRVMGALPMLGRGGRPSLLIVGCGEAQNSGDDQTLVVSREPLAYGRGLSVLWHTTYDQVHITSIKGFCRQGEPPLSDLENHNRGKVFVVAGQFPSPIEVTP